LIKIYPNPSTEDLFLEIPEDGILTIINTRGQIIYDSISIKKGTNHLNLELKPQLYFFKINLKVGINQIIKYQSN